MTTQGSAEGHGCLCLTLGSQRSVEDLQEAVGESMQEGMRRCGFLLTYELIGTDG